MPLTFAKQTACRRRRNFGLIARHRTDPARSSYEIQFYLARPGLVKTCYNCGLPPGTPMARVLQARDVLMAAVDKGLIKNPKAWREQCRQLAGRVRALNRRDGIHPLKPGPKPRLCTTNA